MADENQEKGPSAPATTAEIVQMMFKFIGEQIEAERKVTKAQSEADIELTDAKILKVIQCLNDKIETVNEIVNKYCLILADLDLKIETTTSYNEQLIQHKKWSPRHPDEYSIRYEINKF